MERLYPLKDKMNGREPMENIEVWHKKRDGSLFPALETATMIRNDEERPLYLSVSVIDISRLKDIEQDLEAKTIKLEEMNAALKVLLGRRDDDKTEIEKRVVSNVKELVLPALSRLKSCELDARQEAHLDVLESSLSEIISPFLRTLSTTYPGLTPTEITVANLVRDGKTTKEIAAMMNLSKRSVETYRLRLRKKLGIDNTRVNLRTHLMSLQ
jgi:DNA-binding CsgD family transcriptional regulator